MLSRTTCLRRTGHSKRHAKKDKLTATCPVLALDEDKLEVFPNDRFLVLSVHF